jgi:hypothetical protein
MVICMNPLYEHAQARSTTVPDLSGGRTAKAHQRRRARGEANVGAQAVADDDVARGSACADVGSCCTGFSKRASLSAWFTLDTELCNMKDVALSPSASFRSP